MRRLVVALAIVLALSAFAVNVASAAPCAAPVNLPDCSYTALNGACKIKVNRMWPVTPPTLSVKRGCKVQVEVENPYLLEDLTLDWKSTTSAVPPDTFQTIFGSLSSNLGKLVLLGGTTPERVGILPRLEEHNCEDVPDACKSPEEVNLAQNRVLKLIGTIDPLTLAADAIKSIKEAQRV